MDPGLMATKRLEEECGLPPFAPSSDWLRQAHDLLKSIALHVPGLPSDLVFHHRPAPNKNQRDAPRQILEEHDLCLQMELVAAGGFPAGLGPERFNALHHECPACKIHMDMEQCTCEYGASVWCPPRGRVLCSSATFAATTRSAWRERILQLISGALRSSSAISLGASHWLQGKQQ